MKIHALESKIDSDDLRDILDKKLSAADQKLLSRAIEEYADYFVGRYIRLLRSMRTQREIVEALGNDPRGMK